MKKNLKWVLLFVFFLTPQVSFAAFNLSLNPVDGSNTVRLKSTDITFNKNKEVRVRINSTDGKPYQVFQRLLSPLVNEKGEALGSQVLKTGTIGSSNSSGTLYLQNIEQLGMGERLVYSSGQNGNSDSFIIVYALDSASARTSGDFSGRILLTVRGMNDAAQDEASISISVENQLTLKAEVTGSHSQSRVRVMVEDISEALADFTRISYSGNQGQVVKIFQEVQFLPQNSSGEEMASDVLLFSVESSQNRGVAVLRGSALTRSHTLLMSTQEEKNTIQVKYFVNPLKINSQSSGVYAGKIKYVIEVGDQKEEFFMNLECDIQPVFTLDVVLPPEGISFDNVLPNAPALERELEVQVRSNLHRPYQILQDVQSPMANQKGDVIEGEYFKLKVQVPAGQKGKTRFSAFVPMKTGEQVIYSSDPQGSPVFLKAIYRLQGYKGMSSGNFAAPVRFSLNQN